MARIIFAGTDGFRYIVRSASGNRIDNVLSFNLDDGSYEVLELDKWRENMEVDHIPVRFCPPDGSWLFDVATGERVT